MPFNVTILGSNSALPAHDRHPSAQILQAGDRLFLLDCGEGTQMRLADLRIRPGKIEAVLITHLHGDHYFGLVGLLNSFHLMGRTRELTVFAPVELQAILEIQMRYSKGDLSYPLHFKVTTADSAHTILSDDQLEILSFPLHHGATPTTGFLLKEKVQGRRIDGEKVHALGIAHSDMDKLREGMDVVDASGNPVTNALVTFNPWKPRSYAYCSDTAYLPALAEVLQGVDLMYHEATYADADAHRAAERFHSTARQAAQVAQAAQATRLLLGHFSSRYDQLDSLLAEARSVFPNTDLALEGEVFSVEKVEG
jgi:ribonuclease Z